MPDEPPPSSKYPGQPDRRRPAPTIALKATEIAGDPSPAPPGASEHPEAAPQECASEGASPPDSRPEWAFRLLPLGLPIGAGIAGAALTLAVVGLVMLGTRDSDPGAIERRIAKL